MLQNVTSCKHCVMGFEVLKGGRGGGCWLCDRAYDCYLVRNNSKTHVPFREVSVDWPVATEA